MKDLRATLRAALTHAITEELITRNVAALVKLPAGRKRRRKAWNTEDAQRFLESVRQYGDALYAAYVLALVMGLRKGELLGLSWDDVDLDKGELRVGGGNFNASVAVSSGARRRRRSQTWTLPLVDICVVALKQRREIQDVARENAAKAWQDVDNLVFTTRHGTPVEPRNFNRAWDARGGVGQGAPHHRARRSTDVRLASGRSGCPPQDRNADLEARGLVDHHGGVLPSHQRGDPRRTQAAGRKSRWAVTWLYFAAVQAWSGALLIGRHGP